MGNSINLKKQHSPKKSKKGRKKDNISIQLVTSQLIIIDLSMFDWCLCDTQK